MRSDLTGEHFGRLTVLQRSGRYRRSALWACLCECGVDKVVRHDHLTSGKIISCGCSRVESAAQRVRKHGGRSTPEYNVWYGMIRRCHRPTDRNFRYYGARGISVCKEWREDFGAFLRDVGKRPTPLHSLERKENDGPYSKKNCKWATKVEQANNKRNNRRVTIGNITLNAEQWKTKLGLRPSQISAAGLIAVAAYCFSIKSQELPGT